MGGGGAESQCSSCRGLCVNEGRGKNFICEKAFTENISHIIREVILNSSCIVFLIALSVAKLNICIMTVSPLGGKVG